MVGVDAADDAGVIRLADDRALVQSVDFFTPVVDDPFDWGRIAAANALSDLYAMGAKPLTALQLVGWPRDRLGYALLARVLEGGASVMAAARCVIVGGHSIDDPEPKFGFAVTGTVDPAGVITTSGALAGDALVITKPIGTGIIATAIKRGACPETVRDAAVATMAALNDTAGAALTVAGAHAATDVTGFGLAGHLAEMLDGSSVSVEVDVERVPVVPGTRDLLAAGMFPGGSERNLESVRHRFTGAVDEPTIRLLADAQTSGGLLIALPVDGVPAIPGAIPIGRFVEGTGLIHLR